MKIIWYIAPEIWHATEKFLPYWIIFYPFSPLTTQKIKILYSNWKNACRYYHFTHFHHKWQSYDVRFLRCGAQQTEFFVILDLFLLFYPPAPPPPPLWTQKIKILKKWQKTLKIFSFYKCVPEITVIWCMVPEIWSATNIYNFLSLWTYFCLFTLLATPKNQNFEKMKKPTGDITILHWCTINDNHMMYGSWDIKHDG